jgi:hypothetical protein
VPAVLQVALVLKAGKEVILQFRAQAFLLLLLVGAVEDITKV